MSSLTNSGVSLLIAGMTVVSIGLLGRQIFAVKIQSMSLKDHSINIPVLKKIIKNLEFIVL